MRRTAVRLTAACSVAAVAVVAAVAWLPAAALAPAAAAVPSVTVPTVVRPLALWTPTPANAYGDKPSIYGSCHAGIPDTAPSACILGDRAGTRTVVLVGDSHAANWVPGLDEGAKRRHWRFVSITKTTCPAQPVAVTLSSDLAHPVPYRACARWRSNVIAALPRWKPSVIVVAGSHSTRMMAPNGRVYPGTSAAQHKRDLAWGEATAALLAALHRRLPRALVLVVHDTPIARSDVIACVARTGPQAPTACAVSAGYALRAGVRGAERAAVVRAVAGGTRVRIVDPRSLVCGPAGRCRPAEGGILRYRDAGHLTRTFGRTQGPVWASVLALASRALAAPAPGPVDPPPDPVLWPPPPVPPAGSPPPAGGLVPSSS